VYRNVAVIHLNDIFEGAIEKIINAKPFGLLVILPESDKEMKEGVRGLWS